MVESLLGKPGSCYRCPRKMICGKCLTQAVTVNRIVAAHAGFSTGRPTKAEIARQILMRELRKRGMGR